MTCVYTLSSKIKISSILSLSVINNTKLPKTRESLRNKHINKLLDIYPSICITSSVILIEVSFHQTGMFNYLQDNTTLFFLIHLFCCEFYYSPFFIV